MKRIYKLLIIIMIFTFIFTACSNNKTPEFPYFTKQQIVDDYESIHL